MDNDTFFKMLVTNNPNLSGISITNNVLKYKNAVLPLNSFLLQNLFGSYNDINNDIRYFDSNDFFQLIFIHIAYFKNIDDIKKCIADIALDKGDINKVSVFANIMFYLYKYQNYLNGELRDLLAYFEKLIYILESKYEKSETDKKFLEGLLKAQERSLSFRKVIEEKKQATLKLELKNNQSVAGYVNAFTILLTVLFMGLIFSLVIFVVIA